MELIDFREMLWASAWGELGRARIRNESNKRVGCAGVRSQYTKEHNSRTLTSKVRGLNGNGGPSSAVGDDQV